MIAFFIALAALSATNTRTAFLAQLERPRVPLAPLLVSQSGTVEHLTIASEKKPDGKVERVPILLVRPATPGRHPVVIVLHGTGGKKENMHSWLDRLAMRNIIGVAIDARYHGDRAGGASGSDAYQAAITTAWRTPAGKPQEHPFYYDTVWDLLRTVDYLQTRPDVDPRRIGMLGISMGGIQTWLAAAADPRIAVAVPAISVQSFAWSLEHDAWQARANTIKSVHEAAAKDLGEPAVNARVCRAVWQKLIPGILDRFDGPQMLPLIAPRPLLILSGERDPNNPLGGARVAFEAARAAYQATPDRLKIDVAPGVAHQVTDTQQAEAVAWLERWLSQR